MPESKTLFDEAFQALQRQRVAHLAAPPHPLQVEARARLDERLADVKRAFAQKIVWENCDRTKKRHCEPTLWGRGNPAPHVETTFPASNKGLDCHEPKGPHYDEVGNGGYDLITSCLTLQNANDLAGELAAIHDALAQGGLFLGVLLGGRSLYELRTCLTETEIALTGGAAPRVHPLPDGETMSRLMTTTSFALPVVDIEPITLIYPDLYALMHDLRAHSGTNMLSKRTRHFTPHQLFNHTQEIYAARFPAPQGGIAVTADLIFLHGWREE